MTRSIIRECRMLEAFLSSISEDLVEDTSAVDALVHQLDRSLRVIRRQ